MMKNTLEKLTQAGIVPVVTIDKASDAVKLARAVVAGGLNCIEITFRTEAAEEAISLITKEFPDMIVGAGTILNTNQVDRAVKAGAVFIVSPGINPETVKYSLSKNVLPIPGVSTASEIETAISLGLDAVKFFPAELNGGIKAVKTLSAPYPDVKFMPSGGVGIKNLKDYMLFKKVFACGGSWMVDNSLITEQNFSKITELTKQAVDMVTSIRSGSNDRDGNNCTVPARPSDPKPFENTKQRVVTFGEIMLRLVPEGYYRFVQADRFDVSYGGGEANVAVSLASFGIDAAFVTKLPKNDIGQAAVNCLKRFGVDTSLITRGGERVGIYFLEKGASQRASKVIYDRAGSAIQKASASDFDWDNIFYSAGWFHFTGITPALGDGCAAIALEACKAARSRGLTISCDLNFRKNLWTREKADTVMSELCKYVDLCIANEEDAKDVFGIESEHTDLNSGSLNHDGYIKVAQELTRRFPFGKVAITLRGSISASDNQWGAMLYEDGKAYFSQTYNVHIVDRVGGGDSFGAGLIYAILNKMEPQDAIELAVAASCLKHSIEGDFNLVSLDEVKSLAGGNTSGRIKR